MKHYMNLHTTDYIPTNLLVSDIPECKNLYLWMDAVNGLGLRADIAIYVQPSPRIDRFDREVINRPTDEIAFTVGDVSINLTEIIKSLSAYGDIQDSDGYNYKLYDTRERNSFDLHVHVSSYDIFSSAKADEITTCEVNMDTGGYETLFVAITNSGIFPQVIEGAGALYMNAKKDAFSIRGSGEITIVQIQLMPIMSYDKDPDGYFEMRKIRASSKADITLEQRIIGVCTQISILNVHADE